MPDKCLLLLLDEVRAKTLRILKSVPAEHADGLLLVFRTPSYGMPVMRTSWSNGSQ